jgi:hypothetical protein
MEEQIGKVKVKKKNVVALTVVTLIQEKSNSSHMMKVSSYVSIVL